MLRRAGKTQQHSHTANEPHDCGDTILVYNRRSTQRDIPRTSPFSSIRAAFMCGEHHVSPYISVRTRWLLQQRRLTSPNRTPRGNGSYCTTQILMRTDPALVIHGGLAASTHANKRKKKEKKGFRGNSEAQPLILI